jgi:hypothetical protein
VLGSYSKDDRVFRNFMPSLAVLSYNIPSAGDDKVQHLRVRAGLTCRAEAKSFGALARSRPLGSLLTRRWTEPDSNQSVPRRGPAAPVSPAAHPGQAEANEETATQMPHQNPEDTSSAMLQAAAGLSGTIVSSIGRSGRDDSFRRT